MMFRVVLFCLVFPLLAGCAALPPPLHPVQSPAVKDTATELCLEAEAAYRRQEYRRALQKFVAYLERQPQGPRAIQARLREAELLGLLGDWQGALLKYQTLLHRELDREAAFQARYGLGRANFKLGRYQQAQEVLDGLTAQDLPPPLRFSTYALLAEISLKKGEVEPAFARLRLASQDLSAGDQEWFDNLKTRLVEAATPGQLEHLANLYRDSPLTAPLLLRLARLAQEEGRPADSRKWLDTLRERFPESLEAQGGEGALYASRPRLGCLLPLSGSYADYGNRLKQGMELAAQGTRLELAFRDCPNDPAAAARLVQELAQDSRVAALLGPLTSGDAQAAAQAAQAAGIPLMALSQKQDLTAAGPNIFQVFPTSRYQVRALLRYILGQRGFTRYALFTPESTYGRTLARLFQEELAAQGGVLVAQATFPPGTRDFTVPLSSLLTAFQGDTAGESSFQALFIPDEAPTVTAIASQLAEHPLGKIQFLGTNLANPGEAQETDPAGPEGLLFPDAFFPGDPDPGVQNFIAAYRQRYGAAPDYLALQGYLVVRLLSHLLETQGSLSRADLPQRLLALREVPNLPWFKGFAPDRQAELAIYILTLKNGRVEMVTSPRTGPP